MSQAEPRTVGDTVLSGISWLRWGLGHSVLHSLEEPDEEPWQ